jgi:DNA primase small subunit
LGLKSHERREIVDYISGTGLNIDWVFPQRAYGKKEFNKVQRTGQVRDVPPPGSGGWRGRMRLGIEILVEELRSLDAKQAKDRFPSLSAAQEKIVEGMLQALFEKKGNKDGSQVMLENNNMACFSDVRHEALFIQLLEKEIKPRLMGEIDEPVTSDIKRLIRLPGSLHGKSGFQVMLMTRGDLDDFNPFDDAVPDVFPEKEVEVFSKERTRFRLKGQEFDIDGWCKLPTYAAIFLLCRKKATFEAGE